MILRHARFNAEGTKLAPEPGAPHLVGFGPTEVAPPFPGAATVWTHSTEPTTPRRSTRLRPDKSLAFHDRRHDKKCELCVQLGRTIAINHDYKDCWANPNNPDWRPNIYTARLIELKEKGLPVPALMQHN